MSDLLLIDGALSAEESITPVVAWPAVLSRSRPGVNLPLAGALLLHLLFLAAALMASRTGEKTSHPPEVYPIRLYSVGEAVALSEPIRAGVLPQPVVTERKSVALPVTPQVPVVVTEFAAPVVAATVALSIDPMAIAPLASTAQIIPSGGVGATSPSGDQLAASPGVSTRSGGLAGQVVNGMAGDAGAAPSVLPVVLAQPLYRENPAPEYPALARRRQLEGTVVLEALVTPEGRVGGLTIHESSGHSLLDEAALKAVKDWRFEPGRRGNAVVAMPVLVPVRFGLR